MWLALPFFTFGLAGRLGLTLAEAALFRLIPNKTLLWNVLLTLIALQLLLLALILPNKTLQPTTPLPFSLRQSTEITPRYLTLQTKKLKHVFQNYQYAVLNGGFISQNQYLNLSLMAVAAQEPELAQQFFAAARLLDPNQGYFLQKE